MPRLSSIGLAPAATFFRPSWTIAWASTVAVVVPSPATSLVLVATSFEQLRAHVLERVLELDLLGDGDAVVGDGRGAELLVERDVAALRAERGLDRVGQRVDAALERPARGLVELNDLGHGCSSSRCCQCHRIRRPRRNVNPRTDVYSSIMARMSFSDEDQVLLVVVLELGAGVLGEEHLVADLDVHRDALAVVVEAALADGHDRAALRLLLGRVGQDDADLVVSSRPAGCTTTRSPSGWSLTAVAVPFVVPPLPVLLPRIRRTSHITQYGTFEREIG